MIINGNLGRKPALIYGYLIIVNPVHSAVKLGINNQLLGLKVLFL